MYQSTSFALAVVLVFCGSNPAVSQIAPDRIERGKKATALVEVSAARGDATGTAFCVDSSGLFITNAHVVKKGKIRLVVESGLATQQVLPAKVLRRDDEVDLALLQVNSRSGFTSLDLGRDADLSELAEVTTFGYPFGRMPAVGRAVYPDITVLPSRITALRRDKGELVAVQFDNQLNPGNSGGPVLDGSGKVVGVARAAVRGAAINVAIPVGRLAEFLAAPGLVFEPPPVVYVSRTRPVTWTIRMQPPTPRGRLPESPSVRVTVISNGGPPRTYTAQPVKEGLFTATVVPDHEVYLSLWDIRTKQYRGAGRIPDEEVTVGDQTFRLSDLDELVGGASPSVRTQRGQVKAGAIRGLDQPVRTSTNHALPIDLRQSIQVRIHQQPISIGLLPKPSIEAVVEVSQGTKVLAKLRRPITLTVAPASIARPTAPASASNVLPVLADEGLLTLGGVLNVDGTARGAGKEIKPPQVSVPAARLTAGEKKGSEAPLVRRIDGTISDVAVGGGGRFLLLTLKDVRKVAVFDINAADVVKTLSLPSSHVLVAGGATKVLVVFPNERLLQRWDLATLQRDIGTRPSPIKGRITQLSLGSDSDGPALAFWHEEAREIQSSRMSFIDVASLAVLKVGSISKGNSMVIGGVSASGGCVLIDYHSSTQWHVRASAAGTLFAIWDTGAIPTGFRTVTVRGSGLVATSLHEHYGQLVPDPDGRTVYTGSGCRYDPGGQPIGRVEPPTALGSRELIMPSPDPAYYLSIGGLPWVAFDPHERNSTRGPATISVHAVGDGSRLLIVHGLDEMAGTDKQEDWYQGDFSPDKRFYFVPAAHLLITIPPSNDRLVLRRLDLDAALGRTRGDRLVILSQPNLTATTGQKLVHRIAVRSKKSGIRFELRRGPEGLEVAPDGTLTWMVPERLKGQEVTVVVAAADASGQELFHTIKIRVQ